MVAPDELVSMWLTHRVISDRVHRLLVTLSYFRPDRFVQLLSLIPILVLLLYFKMLHDNNLIEMSLRLNRSEPIFRTILELPGIVRRPRTRDDIRLRRNYVVSWLYGKSQHKRLYLESY